MGAEDSLCHCMGGGIEGSRGGFISVWVGDSGEQRRVYVSVWGWGIVGCRGWFMSLYWVGDSGEQRMVYVSVWVRG